MNVLILNCGSSTLKFQLIATDLDEISSNTDRRLARGVVERIGGEAIITSQVEGRAQERSTASLRDLRAAVDHIVRWATSESAGIEARLIKLSREPMPDDELNREKADLIRMAQHAGAIASVVVHQCPVDKKTGPKDPAKWKEWAKEMHTEAEILIEALEKARPVQVRNAARRLKNICSECHTVFR